MPRSNRIGLVTTQSINTQNDEISSQQLVSERITVVMSVKLGVEELQNKPCQQSFSHNHTINRREDGQDVLLGNYSNFLLKSNTNIQANLKLESHFRVKMSHSDNQQGRATQKCLDKIQRRIQDSSHPTKVKMPIKTTTISSFVFFKREIAYLTIFFAWKNPTNFSSMHDGHIVRFLYKHMVLLHLSSQIY
eukprot:403350005